MCEARQSQNVNNRKAQNGHYDMLCITSYDQVLRVGLQPTYNYARSHFAIKAVTNIVG